MRTEIKTISFTIGNGTAADYQVILDGTQTFDIGDRFNVPENWRCRAAWYQVTDHIPYLTRFNSIKVTPRGDDVDLFLHGTNRDGKVQITVIAIYDAP